VPEITPFRAALVALADEGGRTLRRAAAHNWPETASEALSLDELRARHERGRRLDVAAFVSGREAARGATWATGDRILVEIASPERRWGYLLVDSPLDGRRPSDDSLRMLALLAHQLAAALDNDAVYAGQMRLNFQLRFSRELVRAALGTTDAAQLKPLLTSAAVNGLGGSFAAFAERTAGGWRLDDLACKRTEDYLEAQTEPAPQAERVFARVERSRAPFHWRAADGAVSLAGRRSTRAVLAVPVRADDVLRYVLVVEEDEQDEFDEVTVRAYAGLADQIGLILSRLHYQKYLETTAAELHASYAKLQAAHADIVRLQELLRESLPASTWSALLAGVSSAPPLEAERDAAVALVQLAEFERHALRLPAGQQLALVQRFLGVIVPAAQSAGAQVVRQGASGLLLRWPEREPALRALPALLALEPELNAGRTGQGLPALSLACGASWGPVAGGAVGPPAFVEPALAGEPVAHALRLALQARPGSALIDARLLPAGSAPEEFGLAAVTGRRALSAGRALALLTLREHVSHYR
jgi:GAF domain-containing protein